ncbi:MAG: nitrous oxide-stimulated promoter family protein [Trichlorobacter sp.]|uniref:nitrous oxide-stimulated promoter family protein n=1 Tax=Trichlorobacter sp. TaxID=2911007 RepID=UPI00256B50AA|nr:nitrous oxide-stimulated promoter family protein [Trichlorobacter sp.]MDK9718624.1 nitrous oxide-stimulated promoter family protein [Trichlorobacter sp.]
MRSMHKEPTAQQAKDIKVIARFTEVWCAGQLHSNQQQITVYPGMQPLTLCPECAAFLEYAAKKRLHCPLEAEKPTCRRCRIHCYAPQQRTLVKQIMAWSGKRMILRGRLDYLWHYFF